MPIPKYREFLRPVLAHIAESKERSVKNLFNLIRKEFSLTDEECEERMPGGERRVGHRLSSATSELYGAGLVERTGHGIYKITAQGAQALTEYPTGLTRKDLQHMSIAGDPSDSQESATGDAESSDESAQAPIEEMRSAGREADEMLKRILLQRVRASKPAFLEALIVKLLVAMGYGVSGHVTGQSHDGGIDGVIDEGPLGLEKIAFQAKRRQDAIPVDEIRGFRTALTDKGMQKGVFVTTSRFTKDAEKNAGTTSAVALIDGKKLASLMLRYNIGCREEDRLILKKIDEDFFEDDD